MTRSVIPLSLRLIQEVIRPEQVQQVLSGCHAWEERERRLNMSTLICDVEPSSWRPREPTSARELLARWLGPQMVLLWDSGFHSSQLIFLARACQAHVLGRLKSNVRTSPIKRLSDGSYLTYISEDQDHPSGERLLVRVIRYPFPDERIPGAKQTTHRLVTTLLDPEQSPAKELAVLFHERWHVELVFDEITTHLRLSARTLRSLSRDAVLQEVYALLLTHVAVRPLMRHSATEAEVAPTQLSFTGTVRILDESLPSLTLASPTHRATLTQHLRKRESSPVGATPTAAYASAGRQARAFQV